MRRQKKTYAVQKTRNYWLSINYSSLNWIKAPDKLYPIDLGLEDTLVGEVDAGCKLGASRVRRL